MHVLCCKPPHLIVFDKLFLKSVLKDLDLLLQANSLLLGTEDTTHVRPCVPQLAFELVHLLLQHEHFAPLQLDLQMQTATIQWSQRTAWIESRLDIHVSVFSFGLMLLHRRVIAALLHAQ